jgi:hypothetical protein
MFVFKTIIYNFKACYSDYFAIAGNCINALARKEYSLSELEAHTAEAHTAVEGFHQRQLLHRHDL